MNRKLFSLLVILAVLVSLVRVVPLALAQEDDSSKTEYEITDLPPPKLQDNPHPRLDSRLNQLLAAETGQQAAGFAEQSNIEILHGNVRVVVECLPDQERFVIEAASSLGNIETTYRNLLQVNIPVTSLTALADIPGVRLVRLPQRFRPDVTSEGVSVINADEWQVGGYTGAGVKVAIIDGSFTGYAALLGTELPASVITQSFRQDGNLETGSVHGTACAEIVHDIAPDAELYLVNFETTAELGNAVVWLVIQGVDIISFSMSAPLGGPGDGTGVLCDIVAFAREAGIIWSQSAGNYAEQHWQGTFSDPNGNGFHEFNPGVDESNAITVIEGQTISVDLKWDDSWPFSNNDYNLYLYKDTEPDPVCWSENVQDGDDYPIEWFDYTATETGIYHIAIYAFDDPHPVEFHLYCYTHYLQYQVASGSLSVPADSPDAMTVGAVPWDNPASLEPYSSQGPTDDGRIKPDLVAPDYVSTASYGTTSFPGTSASAPHIAGAAALARERCPAYNITQLQSFLESRAFDMGDIGKDNSYGNGVLDLGNPPTNIWEFETLFPTYNDGEYNSLALDGSGNPHISHIRSGNGVLHYTHWNGFTWQTETVYEHTEYSSLLLDGSGYPCISYVSEQDLYYAQQDGSGWHIEIVDPGRTNLPCLALDSSDNPHISYYNNSNYDLGYARWDGFAWQTQVVDSAGGAYSSIIIDSSDNPHISYCTGAQLRYAYWDGSTWQIQVVDDLGSYGRYTSIALDENDNPHISYYDSANNDLKYTYWDGSTWQIQVIDRTDIYGDTSLAFDSVGYPHIAYDAIYLKHAYWNGYAWQVEILDITNEDGGQYCSLGIDDSVIPNIIHISYYNRFHVAGGNLMYAHITGATFSELTMTVNGGGSTVPEVGSHDYVVGISVGITAIPDDGWEFVNWTGDVADVNSDSTTVTIDTDKTVTANFNLIGPAMEPLDEPEGQYHNAAPAFANFGFDDDEDLDDGWYQIDSYEGDWIELFTDVSGTSWDNDGWEIPDFDALAEGSHTIYFKASDDDGNTGGESGEWSWQFYKDTIPPPDPADVTSPSHTTGEPSSDNTIDITWTDPEDPGSGIDGYSILWDHNPETIPDSTRDIEEGTGSNTSDPLYDGDWYFHLRTVDNAGNWTSTVHLGPFITMTLPGDANSDGEINVLDMTKVARIILLMDPETPGADANQDGVVNVLDMTKIARMILLLDP